MNNLKGCIFMNKMNGSYVRVVSDTFTFLTKNREGKEINSGLAVLVEWPGSYRTPFSVYSLANPTHFQASKPNGRSVFDPYVSVKPLRKQDLKNVTLMDNESDFHVSQQVRDLCDNVFNDYSWGLYLGGVLIGYCTIGYADDVPETIENHPAYVDDCYLLSDVYVCPSYRNLGYGLKLIKEVIENCWSSEEKLPVFLECFDDRVQSFYRKAGFSRIEDKTDLSCMVLEP